MTIDRLIAALRARCPHCLQGDVYGGFMRMNEHCPVCGIKFEREQGYFLMGIFFGYILSFVIVAITLVFLLIFFEPTPLVYMGGASLPLIVLSPWVLKYGRIIWLHVDEVLDPRVSDADKAGELPTPHGIDLMLAHEDEEEDHFYKRKKDGDGN